jgi:multicomponent Na+:H+ antiporter subunit A
VSIGVGVFTFGALVVSGTARTDAPVSLEHTARAQAEAGSRNVVNTILVDFRGIDTFGEIAVVATAALGAVGLLAFRSGSRPGSARVPGGSRRLSPLLQVLVRTVFHTLLVVSLYFLVAGHDAPGGGFVAGLVAGCALVLLSFSDDRASAAVRRLAAPWVLVGAGLAVAAIIGVVGLLAGGAFLEAVSVSRSLPFFGTVKLRSSLGFDVGVYLVVLGAVAAILRAFSRADSEAGAGA